MIKRFRDHDLYNWFDNNMDPSSRTIFMGSVGKTYEEDETGVDHFMAEYFIKGMHLLERKPDEEITIIMNNPGGDWYHGMAIYDTIKCSPCQCIIKVYGHAMSMGSIILQAADHRIMMPNSRFMIHYGSNGTYGHTKIFEKWADEGKRINYQMENIYLSSMLMKPEEGKTRNLGKALSRIMSRQKRSEFPTPQEDVVYKLSKSTTQRREEVRKILREMLNFDTILTPSETISIGLADEIYKMPC